MPTEMTWNDPVPKMRFALEVGIKRAAEFLLAEAVKLVPVDEGTLRASGQVDTANLFGLEAQVIFDTIYAAYIHEGVGFNFSGKSNKRAQAKYLERAAINNRDKIYRIIGQAVREVFG